MAASASTMITSRAGTLRLGLVASVFVLGWSCSGPSFSEGYQPDEGSEGGDAGEGSAAGTGPIGGATNGAGEGAGPPATMSGGAGIGGERDTEPFHIVTVTPVDQSIDVEREPLTIQVTFSAELDADSVDSSSLTLRGPNGAVPGKLKVAKDTLTFQPEAPLALLADYIIAVGTVRSAARLDVALDEEFKFQTRDGVFGEPKRLWSSGSLNLARPLGTAAGHVVASWEDGLTPSSLIVTIFDPLTRKWGEPTTVEDDTVNSQSGRPCVNELGRAFVVTGEPYRWNRYNGASWGKASSVGLTHGGSCVLADDGTALVSWSLNDDHYAATFSPDNQWSAAKTVRAPGHGWGRSPYGAGFMALIEKDDTRLYSYVYDGAQGWLPPKPVTAGGAGVNYVSFDTNQAAAVFTWNDTLALVMAAVFDGSAWKAHELGPAPLMFGTSARAGKLGHLVAWRYQGAAYVERYSLQSGWQGPAKLGTTNGEDYGPAIEVDDTGNAFAAWVNGASIDWRRSSHTDDKWSEVRHIADQDPYTVWSSVDAAGNVMLLWSNPLGIWASRFE